MDKIIENRSYNDPLWNKILAERARYPSTPRIIRLSHIRATKDELCFKHKDLPSRYHWYTWLEHAGAELNYVYNDVPSDVFNGIDTTIEQMVQSARYSPEDATPVLSDVPETFEEFLETIDECRRHHLPFLSKYGITPAPDNIYVQPPVSDKMAIKAISLVQDPSKMEQDMWHIYCIIHDASNMYWKRR